MPILSIDKPKVFRDVKQAPTILLILIIASEIGLNWLYVNFLYDAFSIPAFYTGGLIIPIVVLSFLKFTFIVLGIVFWIGKFKLTHVGLAAKNIKTGILSTFFFWSLIQICLIVFSVASGKGVIFLSGFEQGSPLFPLGSLFLFAVTKALYDELIYRGLILPQLHLKFQRYINLSERITLGFAIVISQALYLIIQTPLLSSVDTNELGFALAFLSLLFLCILNSLIYLRTKNLYISIGIHALWYYPVHVIEAPFPHVFVFIVLIIGFILVWPMLPSSPSIRSTWPLKTG